MDEFGKSRQWLLQPQNGLMAKHPWSPKPCRTGTRMGRDISECQDRMGVRENTPLASESLDAAKSCLGCPITDWVMQRDEFGMSKSILSSRAVSCGVCAAAGSVSVQAELWRGHLDSQRGKQ